jgi:hypothetical protein
VVTGIRNGLTAVLAAGQDPRYASPGVLAFLVIFCLAIATWLLIRSMVGHLRKVRYSAEAAEREAAARDSAGPDGVGPDGVGPDGVSPDGVVPAASGGAAKAANGGPASPGGPASGAGRTKPRTGKGGKRPGGRR